MRAPAGKRSAAGAPAEPTHRLDSLDRARGLAIVVMVIDHLAVYGWLGSLGGPAQVTIGRLAMPLFFLLAGHLAHRLTSRHAWVFLLGALLPVYVTPIDSPNVLCWWALGCVLLVIFRWAGVSPALIAIIGLSLLANRVRGPEGHTYDPWGLWGLMAVGSLIPTRWFSWGDRLPHVLGPIGRHPIAWYAGHLLLLQTIYLLMRGA